jgi:hypothetical protein
MDDNALLGREHELKALHARMDQKRNLVLFGAEGAGKTALVRRTLADRRACSFLLSDKSGTLKESLANVVRASRRDESAVRGKNIPALKRVFYSLLAGNPDYAVFDHLGRTGPRFCALFEYLMDKGIPLVVVCRRVTPRDIGHLELFLYAFEKMEVANLDKAHSAALTERALGAYGLDIARRAAFISDVWHFSNGNPRIIKELCALARDAKYHRNGHVDVGLMDLDRRIRRVPALNVR